MDKSLFLLLQRGSQICGFNQNDILPEYVFPKQPSGEKLKEGGFWGSIGSGQAYLEFQIRRILPLLIAVTKSTFRYANALTYYALRTRTSWSSRYKGVSMADMH